MKRLALLLAAGTMLVAAPAAMAKTATYKGEINKGGTIQLKVKTIKKNGEKKATLTQFKFDDLPVVCGGGGADTTSGEITFRTPVKKKKFTIDAIIGSPKHPESALDVAGTVGKRSASGTIRVHGSGVPLDSGATGDCDSGEARWSAKR